MGSKLYRYVFVMLISLRCPQEKKPQKLYIVCYRKLAQRRFWRLIRIFADTHARKLALGLKFPVMWGPRRRKQSARFRSLIGTLAVWSINAWYCIVYRRIEKFWLELADPQADTDYYCLRVVLESFRVSCIFPLGRTTFIRYKSVWPSAVHWTGWDKNTVGVCLNTTGLCRRAVARNT